VISPKVLTVLKHIPRSLFGLKNEWMRSLQLVALPYRDGEI
jgi:hypothetical protein